MAAIRDLCKLCVWHLFCGGLAEVILRLIWAILFLLLGQLTLSKECLKIASFALYPFNKKLTFTNNRIQPQLCCLQLKILLNLVLNIPQIVFMLITNIITCGSMNKYWATIFNVSDMHHTIQIESIYTDKNQQQQPEKDQNEHENDLSANDQNIMAIFKTLDIDGDGLLNFEEFAAGSIGQTEKQQLETFRKMDKDGNGFLKFEDFKQGFAIFNGQNHAQNLYQNQQEMQPLVKNINANDHDDIFAIFKTLDIDGSGKISFEEFKRAGAFEQNEEVQKDVFENMDQDKDGFLDFEEFKKAYQMLVEPISLPKYNDVQPSAPRIPSMEPGYNVQMHNSEGNYASQPGSYY